jgi:hypothetical protein
MVFMEIISVYSENHIKGMDTLFGQNAELLNVKACNDHCELED